MCYTPAIRSCYPFGLGGVGYTTSGIVWAWGAITMIYGLCTKTSRRLYDHLFKTAGRFMLSMGILFTLYSVGLFQADRKVLEAMAHPQLPWPKLSIGPYQ